MISTCPLCGGTAFAPILTVTGLPVEEGRFPSTAAAAAAVPTGTCVLCHCTSCGLLYDAGPRPEQVTYDVGYTTFMGHSPSFAAHVRDTAVRLVDEYGLAGGAAVDIACGFGDFLEALLGAGMAEGTGIDPAAGRPEDPRIRMVREYFRAELLPSDIALVSCRHMIYLLDDPVRFLRSLRDGLGDRNPVLYLELMNRAPAVLAGDPWDVTYEHRSYFTAQSARRLLRATGFAPSAVREVHHGGFLGVEARPTATEPRGAERGSAEEDGAEEGSALVAEVAGLQARADERVAGWRDSLRGVRESGGRVVAWCAGARAIAFLALAEAGPEVAAVVDLSPARQGRYMPGSARPVAAPGEVPGLAPDAVLVTNTAYTGEVREELARLGLSLVPVVELDDPDGPRALLSAVRGTPAGRSR